MNALQLFNYGAHQVRTQVIDGEPWFVLADLCAVLEISNSRNVAARLDEAGVRSMDIRSGGQMRSVTIVSESGMYEVILRSDKPEAKAFRRWLTNDVIPSIRKTGSFSSAQPQSLEARMHQIMGELDAVVQSQHRELTIARPKASAWDVVVSSAGTWSYNDAAKVISEDGRRAIGEKTLVKCLMTWHFLYRDAKGRPHVYQRFIEQGLFAVKARTYHDHTTGEVKESSAPQVRITGKGLDVIRHRLNTAPYAVTEAAS